MASSFHAYSDEHANRTLKSRLNNCFDPTDANAGMDAAYGALRLMKTIARTLSHLPPGQAQVASDEIRMLAEKLNLYGYDDEEESFEDFLQRLASEQI